MTQKGLHRSSGDMMLESFLQQDKMLEDFLRKDRGASLNLCWKRLLAMKPEEICVGKETQIAEDGKLALRFLNEELFCDLGERCLKWADGERVTDLNVSMIVLLYLNSRVFIHWPNRRCFPSKGLISARQLPNGEVFFKGPHAIPDSLLVEVFGKDPDAFLDAGKKLGAVSLNKGDASFRLQVLPCVDMHFFLYAADDEFPAKVAILFNSSVIYYLPPDGIWAMSCLVVKRLLESEISSGNGE